MIKENKKEVSKILNAYGYDEYSKIVYKKLLERADKVFFKIGQGTARAAYDAGKFVLKVALNRKGLEQNNQEYNNHHIFWNEYNEIIAAIKFISSGNSFLIMEKANQITSTQQFREVNGFGIDYLKFKLNEKDFDENLQFYYRDIDEPINKKAQKRLNKIIDFVQSIDSTVHWGDITELTSWGIASRGGKKHAVLIDYGVNDEIIRKYYGGI